jgi:hypothetical protein
VVGQDVVYAYLDRPLEEMTRGIVKVTAAFASTYGQM